MTHRQHNGGRKDTWRQLVPGFDCTAPRRMSQTIQRKTTFLALFILLPLLMMFSYCSCQQPPSSQTTDAPPDNLTSIAYDYPYASIPNASWINHPTLLQHTVNASDGTQVRVVLLRNPSGFGARFACGFICNGTCATFLFSVFALFVDSGSDIIYSASPHIVWTANRDNPVHENATLQLTSDGDLRLADAHGSLVWSTNTSNRGVASIQLHKSGNLVLADASNGTIWQSWDHLTDTLLPGQILTANQSLLSSASDTNSSAGSYFFGIRNRGLGLYASAPGLPQPYWIAASENGTYAIFNSTSSILDVFNSSDMVVASSNALAAAPHASDTSLQYIRVDSDGILRLYGANDSTSSWAVLYSALSTSDPCQIASYCGPYGLCSDQLYCSCNYGNDSFTQIDPDRPNYGCIPSIPLQCDAASNHSFLQLSNVDYFTFYAGDSVSVDSLDDCKQRCLPDCSCKAAFFGNGLGSNVTSPGSCYLATEVYTMRKSSDLLELQDNVHYQPTALIKVQLLPVSPAEPQQQGKSLAKSAIIGIAIGAGFVLFVCLSLLVLCIYNVMKGEDEEDDEDPFLKSVPGLPSRYTYQQMKDATQNFSTKLGEGGFGCVFLGTMQDGTRVAVKRLEGSGKGQGQREFRNEVRAIASIHHLNLVRLCGFCAEKGQRLLVYEFMPNGSLDHWLFTRSKHTSPEEAMAAAVDDEEKEMRYFLDWPTRFKIALGTAQGLAYLHEECTERIMHFDVKPQNILLNERFEAKVSDFGLSKFVDRNQSQVLTTMRGTPGYLAPEWLHSTVTEKVDVYSYGMVLLEIVSGRRCLEMRTNDGSESGYSYLPSLASLKVEQGKVLDMVDERLVVGGGVEDMEEAERAILVALWCIQGDPCVRPSMSSVVQMLEGIIPVEFPPKLSGLAGIRAPPVRGIASLELNSSRPWSTPPAESFFTSAR